MSRQPRLIQLSVVGTALLGLIVGVYLVTYKRFSRQNPTIIKHSVDTSPDDALKYWTGERMRNAQPAHMPNITSLDGRKERQRRSPHSSDPEHS
jgi:hypothetical protein